MRSTKALDASKRGYTPQWNPAPGPRGGWLLENRESTETLKEGVYAFPLIFLLIVGVLYFFPDDEIDPPTHGFSTSDVILMTIAGLLLGGATYAGVTRKLKALGPSFEIPVKGLGAMAESRYWHVRVELQLEGAPERDEDFELVVLNTADREARAPG